MFLAFEVESDKLAFVSPRLRAFVVKIGFSAQNKASAAAEASIKLAALLLGGLCGFRCLGLASVGLGVLAAEALDASGSIHQLLLAGKERVAVRADFQVNGALVGGPGYKCVSACAVHFCFFVLRMDCWLHCPLIPFAVNH